MALGLFAVLLSGCSFERRDLPEPVRHLRRELPVRPGDNVIIVSFDALRPDALGVYGSPRPVSPAIDAFAADGLVFERAYSTAPVTPTSFAAALSGLLPVRSFQRGRFVAEETLASRFRAAGYATAAFLNNVQLTPERGFDRGFDLFAWSRNDPDRAVLDRVVRWLRAAPPEPFLLWVHFLAPHAPYRLRPGSEDLYDPDYSGPFATTTGGRFEASEPRDRARIRELYDGEVRFADSLFGALVGELEALGLVDRSLVALTSDHGEEFGEHGGFQHGELFEEDLRIPLILRHPGARGGDRTRVLFRNVDLMPTLLGIAALPAPEGLDGVDLLTAERPPETVVAVGMTGAEERLVSVAHGGAKLIVGCLPERSRTLYDLAADPGERRDLAERRPRLAARLDRLLTAVLGGEACEVTARALGGTLPTEGLDRDSLEALRALGYVGD